MNNITDAKLSASQLKFYDDFINNPDTAVGNTPRMFKLPKNIDSQRFADAVSAAVNNHKAFSLRFYKDKNGEPRQRLLADCHYKQEVEHLTDEQFEELKSNIVQKFNFFDEPLIHSRVIETPSSLYWFMDTHHTVIEVNSRIILYEDITRAYNGEPLEPENWGPCDVADYEYCYADSNECREAVEMLKASWKDCCGCFPPADMNDINYSPFMHKIELDVDLPRMAEFTKRAGCQLSLLSAAACSLLLAHESGEHNAALVTAFNCRNKAEIERTVSMVTRYLLFYVEWDKNMAVTDFIASAQQNGKLGRDNVYANILTMNEIDKDFSNFMPFVFQGNMMYKTLNPSICGETASTVDLPMDKNSYIKPFNIHFLFSEGKANLMFLCHKNRYSVEYLKKFAKKYESILNRIQTASTIGEVLEGL